MNMDTNQPITDFNNCELRDIALVKITKTRWQVKIEFIFANTYIQPIVMIASADSFYTEHNGIWWDTQQETQDYFNNQL